MARGRMIDREIYAHEILAELEIPARYFYHGIIVWADDDGRIKASPKYLKAKIFPCDAIEDSIVSDWIKKLVATGLIRIYSVDGTDYIEHPKWSQWQTIRGDRYKPSDCPPPPNGVPTGNQAATNWQPSGYQVPPQPNLTKDNLREPNKDNSSARARNIGEIAPTDFKPPAVTDKTRNGTHAPIARLVGPHVDFVRKFGESYEAMTGEPFKAGNKAYEIAKQLIDRYGAEAVEKKVKILGRMCADQTAWFTKDGWADFTIEKISVQWNSIIATYKETPEDKKRREDLEALKKVREKNERANEAIRRYGAGTSRR